MKKILIVLVAGFFIGTASAGAVLKGKEYKSTGEVISVDPVYSSLSIKHEAIQGFAGDETTVFIVENASNLKGIERGDLVDFDFVDYPGQASITRIERVGRANHETQLPLGRAVQGMLNETGRVVGEVTRPIPAAGEIVGGAVSATTDATGEVVKDANSDVKTKF